MTQREQLFNVLSGNVPEEIPRWLLFPYHQLGCYVDVRNHPAYRLVHEASLNKAIILNRRGFNVPHFSDEVKVERFGDHKIIWSYGDIKLSEGRGTLPDGTVKIKKLLESEEDLQKWCELPVMTDKATIYRQLDTQLDKYLEERKEFPEEYGSMMLDLGEPVGVLYNKSELQEYAIWSITANEYVRQFLDKAMIRYRHIYNYCLEKELAEVYFLVGSELASPPMVSRDTFREWIVPYAGELIEMIHSAGCFAIQHYHGQIKEILPDFLTMNPDGLHTIEAPPIGNCTLQEAFEIVGNKIALIGNIQYDEFRSMNPEEMTRTVQRLKQECRDKRFILSTTAGPFDPNPTERLIENYLAFVNA